jgi:alcohol dehydrogenase
MTIEIMAAMLSASGTAREPYRESEPLVLTKLQLDPPRPGELLVRIDAAGICHSDLSVINGDRLRPMPMALGHEAAATVLATGDPDDAQFNVGDQVVLVFLPACGECVECASGTGYLCPNGAAANGEGRMLRGGHRLSCNGERVHHHLGVSAFASHAVVDRRSAVKVDRDIPAETAALFGCAVLTGVGAVVNTAKVQPGESVLIYGLGGIGLAALLGALAAGAQPIAAVDPSLDKRELALELGAALAVAPDQANKLTLADVVIETAGKPGLLAEAYAKAKRGGRVVTVSLPNPADSFSIPALSLVADSKTIQGGYLGSSIPARDIPRYIALWRAGRLPVERLLTSISSLAEINTLMDRLARGDVIRQVVIP